MTPLTAVLRADASSEMGIGHVMRCLALAQAWQDAGGEAVFAMATDTPQVCERLQAERMETVEIPAAAGSREDVSRTIELCRDLHAAWLVLDGFHFSQEYRQAVRDGPHRLLLFDDHGEFAPYRCDIVLNTNPHASLEMYLQRSERTCFLLGPEYALLRREFLEHPRGPADAPELARKVLITFGGSDPHNVTLRVIEALRELTDLKLELTVVIGSSNRHRLELEQLVRESQSIQIVFNADRMPELIASVDVAVSAGGGTCYELAFQRVPMFLVTMAQNHERTVEAWGERRAAINAGWFHTLDCATLAGRLRELISNRALRTELVQNAARIVDGLGAKRVIHTMWGSQ